MKLSVKFLTLLVPALLLAGAGCSQKFSESKTDNTSQSSTTATSSYQNTTLGFSINFPSGTTVNEGEGTTTFYLPNEGSSKNLTKEFLINSEKYPDSMCVKFDESVSSAEYRTEKIGGVTFKVYDSPSGGTESTALSQQGWAKIGGACVTFFSEIATPRYAQHGDIKNPEEWAALNAMKNSLVFSKK